MVNAYGSNDAHRDTNYGPRSRFYVSTDMTGYFTLGNSKDHKPDVLWLSGYMALMPMYRMGKVSVGIGGALEQRYDHMVAFQSEARRITKSMGFGINYTYGKDPRIKFQVSGRMYYNLIKATINFNQPVIQKDKAISYLIGFGPSYNCRRFQLTPLLTFQGTSSNLFTNFNGIFHVESSIMVNVIYNLKL